MPAPERGKRTKWRDFLRMHWELLAATDFFSVEVWTARGLTTYYVLFVIELSTRRVESAGITPTPDGAFMAQVSRTLTDPEDGFLRDKRYIIHDRDSKFNAQFFRILNDAGVNSMKLPRRSPDLNAYAERFARSIQEDCPSRVILFGERTLRGAISEYMVHFHRERNHQGLDNRLIDAAPTSDAGEVECRDRLGGLLTYYYRRAA